MDARYSSRILPKVGITGTDWRLARVLGSLTMDFQMERLTVRASPAKSGYSNPAQFALAQSQKRSRGYHGFRQQPQQLENTNSNLLTSSE